MTIHQLLSFLCTALRPAEGGGNMVEITFSTLDSIAAGAIVRVDDGATIEDFPQVGGGIGELVVLKTSLVPDNTVVQMTVFETGEDPYCLNPGQSFGSPPWSNFNVTTCPVEGFDYEITLTVSFAENPTGELIFIPSA